MLAARSSFLSAISIGSSTLMPARQIPSKGCVPRGWVGMGKGKGGVRGDRGRGGARECHIMECKALLAVRWMGEKSTHEKSTHEKSRK